MNNPITRFFLTCTLAFATILVWAQPTVTGPGCVLPGTTYQYLINGSWDSTSTMQICVSGGVVAQLNGPCTGNAAPLSAILVIWNSGQASGSLNVNSSAGNTSFTANVTTPLQAGIIDTTTRLQNLGFNAALSIIRCGPDSGGSCKPIYTHQWQRSADNVHWTDIPSATGSNLVSLSGLRQMAFFRRKTIETGSGSIAYSNVAAIFVGPPPPGTSAAALN